MPMYDYECPHCQERFEEMRPLAERATAPCPRCGKEAEKVLSSFFTSSSGNTRRSTPPRSCGNGPLGGG
jgi:putative FmdB family regulatory protein